MDSQKKQSNTSNTPPSDLTTDYNFIKFETYDFNSISRGKIVPARNSLSNQYIFSGYLGFGTLSQLVIFPDIDEKGCAACKVNPDWTTLKTVPKCIEKNSYKIGRVICETDFYGKLLNPRSVCKNLLIDLKSHGITIKSSQELEYSLYKNDEDFSEVIKGIDIFSHYRCLKIKDYIYDLDEMGKELGIDIVAMHPEYSPSCLEVTWKPAFGIDGPDNSSTFKSYAKELAYNHNFRCTFSTKAFLRGAFNGGHFNFSLWDSNGDNSIMLDSASETNEFSDKAKWFLAGIMKHAAALQAFAAPTPLCYDRVNKDTWAPYNISWGIDNRTCLIRAKNFTKEESYFEFRSPSSMANTYLVLASLVAAGLDGIENKIELPKETSGNAYRDDDLKVLPRSFECALKALEEDEVIKQKMNPNMVSWYCQMKRDEIANWEKVKNDDKERLEFIRNYYCDTC